MRYRYHHPQLPTIDDCFWEVDDSHTSSKFPSVNGAVLTAHLQHATDWDVLSRGLVTEWADEAGFSLGDINSQEATDVLLRALLECADTVIGRESWLVNNAADISAGRFCDDLPDLALTLSPTFVKAVLAQHFDAALGEGEILAAIRWRTTRGNS